MAKRGIRKGARDERPVWGSFVMMIDPATGEEVCAWRALDRGEARRLYEQGLRPDMEVTAYFHTNRNLKNFRQAHALAEFVRDNTEAFPADMDNHTVLKRIQVEADIECDLVDEQAYIEGLGWIPIKRRVPRSLAFESMAQQVWREVFTRFKDYCIRTYFPGWGAEEIAQFEDILRGNMPP